MNIWFKSYTKRNGDVITYMNNDRKASIAFDAEGRLPAQYGKYKWTGGQTNLVCSYNQALDNLLEEDPIARGADLSKGCGAGGVITKLGRGWHYAETNIANLGADGAYLIAPSGAVYRARLKI